MMTERMKRLPRRYPNWKRRKSNSPAWLCKERASWRCEHCGVAHRAILVNANGEPYMCYLHAAHVQSLDPDYQMTEPIQDQRLRALCPHCHGTYDAAYRERQTELDHQITMHRILIARFIMQRFTQVY